MRARTPFLAIVITLFSVSCPLSTLAEEPILSPSDLDSTIAVLPVWDHPDPIVRLERRLASLRASRSTGEECSALAQTIDLIRIVRMTRITTVPPSGGPVVASVTRNNDPSARR
jgi:hypothetical protein